MRSGAWQLWQWAKIQISDSQRWSYRLLFEHPCWYSNSGIGYRGFVKDIYCAIWPAQSYPQWQWERADCGSLVGLYAETTLYFSFLFGFLFFLVVFYLPTCLSSFWSWSIPWMEATFEVTWQWEKFGRIRSLIVGIKPILLWICEFSHTHGLRVVYKLWILVTRCRLISGVKKAHADIQK